MRESEIARERETERREKDRGWYRERDTGRDIGRERIVDVTILLIDVKHKQIMRDSFCGVII